MRLSHYLKGLIVFTLLCLMYINFQMDIIEQAYEGKAREKLIHRLNEENGNITYQILSLKSADNLGLQLLEDGTNLRFAALDDIMQISATDVSPEFDPAPVLARSHRDDPSVLGFLTRNAQADPGQE